MEKDSVIVLVVPDQPAPWRGLGFIDGIFVALWFMGMLYSIWLISTGE